MHGWCDRDGHWLSSDIRRNTLQMKRLLVLPVVVYGAVPSLRHGTGVIEIDRQWCLARLAFRFQHKMNYWLPPRPPLRRRPSAS